MSRLVLFGAGKIAEEYLPAVAEAADLLGDDIVAIADNMIPKQGIKFYGNISISSPENIEWVGVDVILMTNITHSAQIIEQLRSEYCVDESKIHSIYWIIQRRIDFFNAARVPKQHHKRRIYDCFTFNNELDLLEMRLEILNPFVDYFVLVEIPKTQKGKEKILYYRLNEARYQRFHNKIRYVTAENIPTCTGPDDWSIEYFQRNLIAKGLDDSERDDVVIISDLDEFPDVRILDALRQNIDFGTDSDVVRELKNSAHVLSLKNYYYNFYTKFIQNLKCNMISYRYNMLSPQEMRNYKNIMPVFHDAGCHLSYFGGHDMVKAKTESIIEGTFVSDRDIDERIRRGKDLYNRKGPEFEMEHVDLSCCGIPDIEKYKARFPVFFDRPDDTETNF